MGDPNFERSVVLMLEHSIYSVISPEGCAAILWRDRVKAPEAAEALKLTSKDLQGLEVIDEIIPEPMGGAHRAPDLTAQNIKERLIRHIDELSRLSDDELVDRRCEKFLAMGVYAE